MPTPYEHDYFAWSQEQAAALRRMAERRVNTELDLEHLAEEIEELGGSDLRALESDLVRIIEHLLKLRYSPAQEPRRGWILSVVEHRDRVQATIERSNSLARRFPDLLPAAWRRARRLAAKGLELDGLDPGVLPDRCPWDLETEILGEDWWP